MFVTANLVMLNGREMCLLKCLSVYHDMQYQNSFQDHTWCRYIIWKHSYKPFLRWMDGQTEPQMRKIIPKSSWDNDNIVFNNHKLCSPVKAEFYKTMVITNWQMNGRGVKDCSFGYLFCIFPVFSPFRKQFQNLHDFQWVTIEIIENWTQLFPC